MMTRSSRKEMLRWWTNLWEGTLGEDTAAVVSIAYTYFNRCIHSHEKTGLSTSTVTDNDQLATDLRHLR